MGEHYCCATDIKAIGFRINRQYTTVIVGNSGVVSRQRESLQCFQKQWKAKIYFQPRFRILIKTKKEIPKAAPNTL